jgi:hypothetical protein
MRRADDIEALTGRQRDVIVAADIVLQAIVRSETDGADMIVVDRAEYILSETFLKPAATVSVSVDLIDCSGLARASNVSVLVTSLSNRFSSPGRTSLCSNWASP